jgi:hypothetical protein
MGKSWPAAARAIAVKGGGDDVSSDDGKAAVMTLPVKLPLCTAHA